MLGVSYGSSELDLDMDEDVGDIRETNTTEIVL